MVRNLAVTVSTLMIHFGKMINSHVKWSVFNVKKVSTQIPVWTSELNRRSSALKGVKTIILDCHLLFVVEKQGRFR